MMLGQYLYYTETYKDPTLVESKYGFYERYVQAHKIVHITKGDIYCLGRYMHFTLEAYNEVFHTYY